MTPSPRRAFAAVIVALAVESALAAPAHAKGRKPHAAPAARAPRPPTEAARLKAEGDALMDQDKYADALSLYVRAYDLSKDPALLYNEGRALEAMGEYPDALDRLEQFELEAPESLRARVPGLHEHMDELRAQIATVIVTTNAPGARLLLRDKLIGTIDHERRVRARAGSATVEVVADGYEPFRRDLELAPGKSVSVDAKLVPKKVDTVVFVKTRPSADVTIDGRPIGRAPLEAHLPPGGHVVVAHAAGHYDEKVKMTLSLGEHRDLDLELRETPAITSRWWFWTGVGVVILGGAAAAYAVTQERPHGSGTFSPGAVPGP